MKALASSIVVVVYGIIASWCVEHVISRLPPLFFSVIGDNGTHHIHCSHCHNSVGEH